MKWNDIRDRLKKSSNSVMESFKPESMMVNNSVGAGGVPVSSMKKTDFKKIIPIRKTIFFIVGEVIIAWLWPIYWLTCFLAWTVNRLPIHPKMLFGRCMSVTK